MKIGFYLGNSYVTVCMWAYMNINMYEYMHVYMFLCVYAYVLVRLYASVHLCANIDIALHGLSIPQMELFRGLLKP